MKTFNDILKEAKGYSQDGIVKNGGVELIPNRVVAYCRRAKNPDIWGESDKKFFDLVIQGPKETRVIDNWATYTVGYPQTGFMGGRTKAAYFLKTESGYSGGNGDQRQTQEVPMLRYYRYMDDHIKDHYKDEILDVSGGPEN